MLTKIKSAVKNSAIYSIGSISTKIIGLILLPIYTKHLTVSDYGILGIIEVSTQLLISVFGLALYQAFFRWYWDKEYKHKQKSMFFTSTIFLVFISILMYLGFYSFSEKFSVLLFDKTAYSYLLKIMVVSAGLQIVAQMPSTLMRLQERPILYSATNIVKLIITLILTIYFIVFLKKNVEGIYEAQVIGLLVYFLTLSKYIWKNIRIKLETKILKGMLTFSLPLIFASISGVIFSIADRYCLKFLGNLSEVGIYSLGFKIANTIKVFVITSVQLAISPIIFKMMDAPNNKRFYSKIMTYFTFGVMICVLGMSFFGKEIIKFLAQNKDYWEAYKVIPIISFALLFGMLKDTSMMGLNIAKKTKIIAITMTIMSVFNIALNIVLIPHFQSIGAAIATLISQAIFFIAIFKIAQKYYYIPYEISKIIKMIILGVILFGLSLLINNFSLIFRVLLKLSMIGAFPLILYCWNFYEKIEILRLKQSWHKWKNPGKWKENISKNKVH
ncbi:MAG: oligosaccharide flippase family protein [Candidatus Marinimicrobia bacterium]|nr:oligosaccharide flippase family protein [Candidatus Neomarinimicrobiota bacterium]